MAEVAGIFSAIFGPAFSVINQLKQRGGIADTGVIIDHNRNEIECQISINLGQHQSRSSGIGKKLASLMTKKITINDVRKIRGFGFITNENLEEIGIIKHNGKNAEIDFPRMFKDVQAQVASINLRKSISPDLVKSLIATKLDRVPQRTETSISTNYALVLNHGELWYAQFGSFSVRNIRFAMDLSIQRGAIQNAVPQDLRNKLNEADEEALTNPEARKYLLTFERTIMKFQDSEFISELSGAVSVSNPSSIRLVEIIPKMQGYKLRKSGLRTMLPGKLTFVFEAEIEDKEKAINGSVSLDLKQYRSALKYLIDRFGDEAKNINF